MNSANNIELISFKICPFVQRSVIALNEKKVDYKISYIDLSDRPDWFSKISPLGKVPVLKVGDTPIFESAVIAEYLDETFEPRLHPDSALERARHRSWIEYASEITMSQYRMLAADNKEEFENQRSQLIKQLKQVKHQLTDSGPFFSANGFSLIDTTYAPIFMRLDIINTYYPLDVYPGDERLEAWSQALLAMPSVKHSVVNDFEEEFVNYFKQHGQFIGPFLDKH
jgi:glutathione S-transferase